MPTVYRTTRGRIEIQDEACVRTTKSRIVLTYQRTVMRYTTTTQYHDTYKEAKAYLTTQTASDVRQARYVLIAANARLSRIQALKQALPTP